MASSDAPTTTALSRSGGELCTAFTSLAALSRDDDTRRRMLASQRPTSAPLVDAVWVRSWLEAFAPVEPVLLATRTMDGPGRATRSLAADPGERTVKQTF